MTQQDADRIAADMVVGRVAGRLAAHGAVTELHILARLSAQEVDVLILLEREGWA